MTGKCRGLTKVDSDKLTPQSRQKMYSNTGIFSVTSRILIVDFLSGLVDVSQVTGIILLHAETVSTTSVEAFILRKYRQENKKGFLKAFSDVPEAFTSGFAPLSTMLKNLFLRKAALYPRFQVDVARSLEGRKRTEVIELDVSMTESMKVIQNSVMECTEASISELKKLNSGLEMDDWNMDNALQRNFHRVMTAQLQPVMHRVSIRTRQILNDLRTLHEMLQHVMRQDAVSFERYLETVLMDAQPPEGKRKENPSPWLLLDAADTLFETARRRVYTGKLDDGKEGPNGQNSGGSDTLHPVLEELPKWEMLADVLAEIEQDVYFNPVPQDDSSGAILIMCADHATGVQIREYLQSMHVRSDEANGEDDAEQTVSASFMMRRKLRNYIQWKRNLGKISASIEAENQKQANGQADGRGTTASRGRQPANKRRRVRGASSAASGPGRDYGGHTAGDKDAHINNLLASLELTEAEAQEKEDVVVDPLHKMEEYYSLYEMQDLVVVHPYDGDMDEHVLEEVKPRYVIMFEPDAAFIRRIEVYRSSHTDRNVRVYFMYYGESVEEQRYLAAVRKEKDAFTKLIRERGVS
jgi:DNA excision repair protein ERCC-4